MQNLSYNMAGAKLNGAVTFLSLYTTGSTLFIKQIWAGLNGAVTFYGLKIE